MKIFTIKESYRVDAEASDCFSEAKSMARMPPVEVPQITSKTFRPVKKKRKKKGEKNGSGGDR